jgi:hypothetical protein
MTEFPEHPRDRLTEAGRQFGERRVALWCANLLVDRVGTSDPAGADPHTADPDSADPARPLREGLPLGWLGGVGAAYYLEREAAGNPEPDYWPRVWAARGLLYVWDDDAEDAVIAGLDDPAWRVREMCAKVIRLHQIGAAGDKLVRLCGDEVPRVRVSALRGLARIGESEHVDAVEAALDDEDRAVVAAAERALEEISSRLDRELG